MKNNLMKSLMLAGLFCTCLILSSCGGIIAGNGFGYGVENVTVGLSDGEHSQAMKAGGLTPNTFSSSSLMIKTVPVCGGQPVVIVSANNPATNIPVCADSFGEYPQLVQANVTITGVGQGTRTYTLDFTNPANFPNGLSLKRSQSGNNIEYQIVDTGGAVQSATNVVTDFIGAGLAVSYEDDHFLETLSYQMVSDAVLKASYDSCPSCIADLSASVIPSDFSVVSNDAGSISFDTSLASQGSYQVVLAVKQSATSSVEVQATLTVSITRNQITSGGNGPGPFTITSFNMSRYCISSGCDNVAFGGGWGSSQGATGFTYSVGPNQDCSAPVFTQTSDTVIGGFGVAWGPLAPGTYYLCVTANGPGGSTKASNNGISVVLGP